MFRYILPFVLQFILEICSSLLFSSPCDRNAIFAMDHGVPAYTDCIVDNMYDPYHKNMTIKIRQEYICLLATPLYTKLVPSVK